MLGRNRSAAFDSRRTGSDVSGRGKLASFARKFQRKNYSSVTSVKEEAEILVVSTPTRNVDFVNKLKAISREHVVEAVRSRSLETRSDREQGTVTTVGESVNSVHREDGTTKRNDDRENNRATDNILQWAEHVKLLGCGSCEAMPWSRNSREDSDLLRKSKLSLTHNKRSTEHIRHHWEAVLDDRDEVDKLYSPPFDLDMDKTSESRVSTVMTDDSSTHGRGNGLAGDIFGYHPKYSMSYATGAETTENGDGTSYASSLYSSFASEPGHFDDSTTITTNY